MFVKSEDNHADSFTKNVTGHVCEGHTPSLVVEKKEVMDEPAQNARGRVLSDIGHPAQADKHK